MWDIDTLDWKTHNLDQELQIVKDTLNQAPASESAHIALEHEVISFDHINDRIFEILMNIFFFRLTSKLSSNSCRKSSNLSRARDIRWSLLPNALVSTLISKITLNIRCHLHRQCSVMQGFYGLFKQLPTITPNYFYSLNFRQEYACCE